ncbi:hypothetical protein PR048_006557 [Dryococelus australis]|uniref:DUF4371 domain-containing protein n=1 Tax=Dryococelus australis TaxID=614101 RepID=A0ABQ9IBE4_9NEOP|nr:hypothetical protein PR048_006557 [Dryococelus australis]
MSTTVCAEIKSRSSMKMSVASAKFLLGAIMSWRPLKIKRNFLEMLETVCEEDQKLKQRISLRCGHYCSPEYQNDLISVYSLRIGCIAEKSKEADVYSIMVDETKDVFKVEQLAILIRYVDCEDWKVKERVIGLHHLKDCMSKILKNFEAILIVLDEGMRDRAECVGIRA